MAVIRYGLYNKQTGEVLAEGGGPQIFELDILNNLNEMKTKIEDKFNIECEIKKTT